jgi:hypothetical protein
VAARIVCRRATLGKDVDGDEIVRNALLEQREANDPDIDATGRSEELCWKDGSYPWRQPSFRLSRLSPELSLGGLTSFGTTWFTQRTQLWEKDRLTRVTKLEALYNEFIGKRHGSTPMP